MMPPSDSFLTDSCVVYGPPAEAFDSEGGSSLLDGSPSAPLRCLMDSASASGQPFARQGDSVPMGMSRRVLIFATAPPVTVADQKLVVTTRLGDVFALRSLGPVEPPYGVQLCWSVAADVKV